MTKSRKNKLIILIIAALLFIGGTVGVTLALYGGKKDDGGAVSAERFFFGSDALYPVGEIKQTVISNDNSVTFSVRNYEDELRVSASDVTYTVSVTETDGKAVSVLINGIAASSGTLYAATGRTADEITIVAPTDADSNVTVTVKSTSPYVSTLQADFLFSYSDTKVTYTVVDSSGSETAELIIIPDRAIDTGTLVLDWRGTDIDIDTNSKYVMEYDYVLGKYVVQSAVENKYLTVKRPIGLHESVSITFFKTDKYKNYEKIKTAVTVSGDNIIVTISMGNI